jgi:hypothetical protein
MFKRKGQRSNHSAKSYGIEDHVDKSINVETCSGSFSLSSSHHSRKTSMKHSRQPSTVASTQSASRSYVDDDISTPLSISKKIQRSVMFSFVHIREFERILGDNPSCSSGAPIS